MVTVRNLNIGSSLTKSLLVSEQTVFDKVVNDYVM